MAEYWRRCQTGMDEWEEICAFVDNAVWVEREAEDIMFGDFRIDHPEGGPIDFWLWDDRP